MKKHILIPTLFFAIISTAQVANGDFETIKSNFLPSNWGMNFTIPVSIDIATGQNTTNTIQYSGCIPGMCTASWDAHSGNTAMEISNALNTTQNTVIKGSATIFADATQDSPGWQPGVPIDVGMNVNMLGFYYKYFPAGNETATATLTLFNNNSQIMGTAEINLTATIDGNYHYIFAPVNFIETGTPAWMYIDFATTNDTVAPVYGTRLIIDDVVVNSAALANQSFENKDFTIFPTLVNNEINIKYNSLSGDYNFQITNLEGQIVNQKTINFTENQTSKIDVSNLSSGIYFIKTEGFTSKFIKQ